MQRVTPSAATTSNAAPFFVTNIFGGGNSSSNGGTTNPAASTTASQSRDASRPRPATSSGEREERPSVLTKERKNSTSAGQDRKGSFGRKSSFSAPSPSRSKRRSSSVSYAHGVVTDAAIPPALPDFALAAAAKVSRDIEPAVQSPASTDSFPKMLNRSASAQQGSNYPSQPLRTPPIMQNGDGNTASAPPPPTESNLVYQHIQEIANKRISTLDYLRKTHEGRVYWFNTLLFDKPDLARMPYFDNRKLARRATNYLLLGLSLPTVIDLNSSTPLEFLRSLNTLLTEFESFQAIHTENGTNASSLSRARLPQMFRRGPGGKGRRTSGAAEIGYSEFAGGGNQVSNSVVNGASPASVISFGLGGEGMDLLPGEEYTHLLTPNLPFDPDFFETFATLCDVLIDCYTRLMSLLPSAKECSPPIAELFTKADARVRKIIIQGVVKEFEDTSRNGLKQEVGNVSKVVLGALV